jgi:hypothetical protein
LLDLVVHVEVQHQQEGTPPGRIEGKAALGAIDQARGESNVQRMLAVDQAAAGAIGADRKAGSAPTFADRARGLDRQPNAEMAAAPRLLAGEGDVEVELLGSPPGPGRSRGLGRA